MNQFCNNMKDKKIIIFGTGNAARIITEKIPLEIYYYIDNDGTKLNTYFMKKAIKPPQVLLEECRANICIIIASIYYDEISSQLKEIGLREDFDFFSALDMFINPFDFDKEKVIRYEIDNIKNKLTKIMRLGYFEDAEKLLKEYEELVPFDERIEYFRTLIALNDGKLNEVKNYTMKGIEFSNYNINLNYDFTFARKQEENKQILEALKTYEMLLAQNKSYRIVERIVNTIENLEKRYKTDIFNQLIQINHFSEHENKEGLYNLHLMFDHFHIKKFIELIDKCDLESSNIFLVFRRKGEEEFLNENSNPNICIIEIKDSNYEKVVGLVERYLERSNRIFIHYLHNFICWLICRCNITRNLNWVLWGGDLYSYLDINLYDKLTEHYLSKTVNTWKKPKQTSLENRILNIYRKATIRRLTNILTWNEGDYTLVCQNFTTVAKHSYFSYPNPVDFNTLECAKSNYNSKYKFKNIYKYVFLLGNSADPSNNHLDILEYLNKFKNKNFCVIIPASYGGNQVYTDKIITESKRLLEEKAIVLTEFLNTEEYALVLNQVDVAIMNHNRQQGAGNILALLYLGKKVYIKEEVTTFKAFSKLGSKVYSIKELKNSSFEDIIQIDNNIQVKNSEAIFKFFNEKKLKDNYNKLFN